MDPAIKRAGRLDREIALELPDPGELEKIFRFHLDGDLLTTDLLPLTCSACGATVAEVAAWVKRARGKARRERRAISLPDLTDQLHEGARTLTAELHRRFAVHEAGHVLVGHLLDIGVFVRAVMNIAGGWTEMRFTFDTSSTAMEIQSYLTLLMAWRAAEQLILGNVSAGSGVGADSDLAKATSLAVRPKPNTAWALSGPSISVQRGPQISRPIRDIWPPLVSIWIGRVKQREASSTLTERSSTPSPTVSTRQAS